MKKILILLIMGLALSSGAAFAQSDGGCHNPNNPHFPCDEDDDSDGNGNGNGGGNGGDSNSEANSDADATASADAAALAAAGAFASGTGIGVGIGEGGDASATGGDASAAGGNATGVGGDAAANAGISDSGNARNSTSVSTSYNYEEAARSAATLLVGVCQDGTSVQGVKFGLSTAQQSLFCKFTTLAQLQLSMSNTLQCAVEDHDCWGDKEFLREDAVRNINQAAIVAYREDHEGFAKALFHLVW
jgi:hypothetical protein